MRLRAMSEAVYGHRSKARTCHSRSELGDQEHGCCLTAQWLLGMVCLVKVVLESGKRACPPQETSAVVPIA